MNEKKLLKKINQKALHYRVMSDKELQLQTLKLRERNALGTTEDALLITAFSVIREASKRVLKMYPTDEQVLGGIIMAKGSIAEMKTGEGKSLSAIFPIYLKALTLGRAFLITSNSYLAQRDKIKIGPVYEWLGLNISDGEMKSGDDRSYELQRKEVYSADIIYISNSSFGFDFLLNGLVDDKKKRFMPELTFCLIDEIDEILIDTAQTPLIISGKSKVQSNYFDISYQFVQTLDEKTDYKLDSEKKNIWFTEVGIEKAKNFFSVDSLLDLTHFNLYQHLVLALKAEFTLLKNKDYIVEGGDLKLLSHTDGRILEGSSLQNGLQQALQTKEKIKKTPESQTISSITYQNLFRHFYQLTGMSGTAKVAESEFIETYNLPVKTIKPHKRSIRKDYKFESYVTVEAKMKAALKKIQQIQKTKQPLLIITGSVDTSELMSLYLLELGIAHNVLNAKSSIKEAQIIAEAGKLGAVTVSTTMAGRGTDIKLSPESIESGGLAVVIIERLSNKRGELQARGRAGRQGEPGVSYSYDSLEDNIIKQFRQESIQHYYLKHYEKSNSLDFKQKPQKIRNPKILHSFRISQKKAEEEANRQRYSSLQYDNVVKIQRELIDNSREKILTLTNIQDALFFLKEHLLLVLSRYFKGNNSEELNSLQRFIWDTLDYNFKSSSAFSYLKTQESKKNFLIHIFENNLLNKRTKLQNDSAFLRYLQVCILKAIDTSWSSQIEDLSQLKYVVFTRTAAQKNPVTEYEKEAQKSYIYHKENISNMIIKNVALSLLEIKNEELIINFP